MGVEHNNDFNANIESSYYTIGTYPKGMKGKTAIVRLDLNSPVDKDTGTIIDDPRIREHAETVAHLTRCNCSKIILISHQGRKGKYDFIPLREHAQRLTKHLREMVRNAEVHYLWAKESKEEIFEMEEDAVVGDKVMEYISSMPMGAIILLENARLLPYEEAGNEPCDYKDTNFVKRLSGLKDAIYIFDGFSVAHRSHCSVIGLSCNLDTIAGDIVSREIEQIRKVMVAPKRPVTLVSGGAKLAESIDAIEQFLATDRVDNVLTCGLVGLIFLLAGGIALDQTTENDIRSNFKDDKEFEQAIDKIRRLLARIDFNKKIYVPDDVAIDMGGGNKVVVELDLLSRVSYKHQIKDIGVLTAARYALKILESRTIIMNGPAGVYELGDFRDGTDRITGAIGDAARWRHAVTLIGGGDTLVACDRLPALVAASVRKSLSGKAFLQTLASGRMEMLPGIKALMLSRRNCNSKK